MNHHENHTLFQGDGQAAPIHPAGGIEYPNGRHPDEYPKSRNKAKAAPDTATPAPANMATPGETIGTPAPSQLAGNTGETPVANMATPGGAFEPGGFSTVISTGPAGVVDDPFSPENLKLSQDFSGMTETRRLLTVVRVGKPRKETYVRTSPIVEHWIGGCVLELKDEGDETYWVVPALHAALSGEPCLKPVRLILSVDRPGNPFFWKIAMPDATGRSQPWIDSMMDAAIIAKKQWVRVAWSGSTRAYEVTVASIQAEPKWPTESVHELLNIAFRGRVVTSLDHPILRTLRGLE